jgi:hypothetical protein
MRPPIFPPVNCHKAKCIPVGNDLLVENRCALSGELILPKPVYGHLFRALVVGLGLRLPFVWQFQIAYFDAARIRFPLSVTAPVSAKTRPVTLAPVLTVSLIFARMLPSKAVFVPRVAELVTCQNTFPAVAPLARTTEELLAVVSVLFILKT